MKMTERDRRFLKSIKIDPDESRKGLMIHGGDDAKRPAHGCIVWDSQELLADLVTVIDQRDAARIACERWRIRWAWTYGALLLVITAGLCAVAVWWLK